MASRRGKYMIFIDTHAQAVLANDRGLSSDAWAAAVTAMAVNKGSLVFSRVASAHAKLALCRKPKCSSC